MLDLESALSCNAQLRKQRIKKWAKNCEQKKEKKNSESIWHECLEHRTLPHKQLHPVWITFKCYYQRATTCAMPLLSDSSKVSLRLYQGPVKPRYTGFGTRRLLSFPSLPTSSFFVRNKSRCFRLSSNNEIVSRECNLSSRWCCHSRDPAVDDDRRWTERQLS